MVGWGGCHWGCWRRSSNGAGGRRPPQLIVRREHQLREVSQADIDAYVTERLADVDEDEAELVAAMLEGLPTLESFPAFESLEVDARGYLWVEEYQMPGVERTVWTVFDADGHVQGLVETPLGLDVYEIGEDYILGRAMDDFDIEYVQMFRLTRFASAHGAAL